MPSYAARSDRGPQGQSLAVEPARIAARLRYLVDRRAVPGSVAAEAGQDGLKHRKGVNDLPRPDRQIPEWLKLLPSGGVGQVPKSPAERFFRRSSRPY